MKQAYIVYAKRTAIGKLGGQFSHIRPDDLLARLLVHFKENHSQLPLEEIDDVIVGCANQAGEDNRNIARMSLLLADFPFEVPGVTLNRLCASSLDAVIDAWSRICSGMGDAFLVGGVEGMTRAPYVLSKSQQAFGRNQTLYDTSLGWRFPNPKMLEKFPLLSMGETAEEVAAKYKISRQMQDEFAYSSHQKALKAQSENKWQKEIVPIEINLKKESFTVTQDEGPRADTNIEKLSKLRTVFKASGTVTAGNSSSLNDGAGLVFVASEDFIKRHSLTPIARITGGGVKGCHPNIMGIGPVGAVKKLCQRFSLDINRFDAIELNEAFAAQSLACINELSLPIEKVNIKGGAIALGHPLGQSGVRILTTLTHILQENNSMKNGLATMCVGVGQGVALSIEKC